MLFMYGNSRPDRQLNGRIPYPQSPRHLCHRDPRHGLHGAISCNTELPKPDTAAFDDPAAFDFFDIGIRVTLNS